MAVFPWFRASGMQVRTSPQDGASEHDALLLGDDVVLTTSVAAQSGCGI
jgi:hypothetical protein